MLPIIVRRCTGISWRKPKQAAAIIGLNILVRRLAG